MQHNTTFYGVYTYVVKQFLNPWTLKAQIQIVATFYKGGGWIYWERVQTVSVISHLLSYMVDA